MGKNTSYKSKAVEIYSGLPANQNHTAKSKQVADELGVDYTDTFRRTMLKWVLKADLTPDRDFENVTTTETSQYGKIPRLSALKPDGGLMSIDEFCKFYGIQRDQVKSFKLVSHTSIPYYNIASVNVDDELAEITLEDLKELLAQDLLYVKDQFKKTITPFEKTNRPIVATLADFHFGAYVDNLIKTRTFSIDILIKMLEEAADRINKHQSSEVHVHLLGDLIESFTGLNHINSWKGLQKGMIGAEVIKLTVKVLHDNFLSRIVNLKEVYVISGNHDRVTANKTEDTEGDVANLIAWGLELIGYNVEYNSFVLTHLVDNINYILLHGHDPISKKSTKDICWDYGKQGNFNFITEGHLHSIIEKLSSAQKKTFNTIKDDAVDHRRMNCPSFFTGNSYSERLGYTSNSGFIISENNGKGVPNVYFYAL